MGTCSSSSRRAPRLQAHGSDLILDAASGELVHMPRPLAGQSPRVLTPRGVNVRAGWRFGKTRVTPESGSDRAADSPGGVSAGSRDGVAAALAPGFSVNPFDASGSASVGTRWSSAGRGPALVDPDASSGPRPRSSGGMALVGTCCDGDESPLPSRGSVASAHGFGPSRQRSLSSGASEGTPEPAPVIAHLRRKSEAGVNADASPAPPLAVGASRASSMRWSRGRALGSGTQGSVFLAMSQADGVLMAVKQVPLPDRHDELETTVGRVRREVDLLMYVTQ